MNELVTAARSVKQYKNPTELANAWQSKEDRFQPDGSHNTSHLNVVQEVEDQALELVRSSESAERSSGVVLLSSLSSVCSPVHFVERCPNWVQPLVSSLQKNGPEAQKGISHLLSQLLERASEFSSLTSDLASHVTRIIDCLIQATPEWQDAALLCLNTCMQCYPGPCLPNKEKILKALLPLLDVGEPTLQESVARCMASVPSIGAGGGQAVQSNAVVWQKWCNLLLTTLSDTMDKIVSPIDPVQTPLPPGVPTFNGGDRDNAEKLALPEPTETEPNRSALLLTRCQSLCCCIKTLLRTAYPVAVSFPLQGILAMVCRILAVTQQQLLTHPSLECILLFGALPAFYASAVDLLTAVTSTCKQFLLTQSWLINQLLLQVLSWTGDKNSSHSTPYSRVRISAHRMLRAWVWVLGSGLDAKIALHFVKHLVNAANPPTTQDKSNQVKSSQKEKEKTGPKDKSSSASVESVVPPLLAPNPEMTISALEALKELMGAAGPTLPPECHQAIQLFLIPLVMKVNRSHLPTSGLPPPKGWWTEKDATLAPYDRADCRKALFDAMLACVLADHQSGPTPLHHAITIFTEGLRDPNMEVSLLCRQGLTACNLVLHPRIQPTPFAPMSAPPVQDDELAMDTSTPNPERKMTLVQSMMRQQKSLAEKRKVGLPSCLSAPPIIKEFRQLPVLKVTDLHKDPAQGPPSDLLVRRRNRQRSATSSSPADESPTTSLSATGLASPSTPPSLAISGSHASSASDKSLSTTPVSVKRKTRDAEPVSESVGTKSGSRAAGLRDQTAGKQNEPAAKKSRQSDRAKGKPAVQTHESDDEVVTVEVTNMIDTFVDSGPDSDGGSN